MQRWLLTWPVERPSRRMFLSEHRPSGVRSVSCGALWFPVVPQSRLWRFRDPASVTPLTTRARPCRRVDPRGSSARSCGVFRHCIHCTRDLGANEAIERLPIGRRIAFDPARGRLWVVCAHCARWNLVPFEERWEALEACERAFRGTPLRRSTDNIGLARVADGLELVRIGRPLRPEFAAWRYARAHAGRYVKAEVARWSGIATLVALNVAGVISGGLVMGVGLGFTGRLRDLFVGDAEDPLLHLNGLFGDPVLTRVMAPDGRVIRVRRSQHHTVRAAIVDGTLRVRYPDPRYAPRRGEWLAWEGAAALPVLRTLLPAINRWTGSDRTVDTALQFASTHGGIDGMLRRYTRPDWSPEVAERGEGAEAEERRDRLAMLPGAGLGTPLATLSAARRLALEMALHEDDERRWLDGELHDLERHWREAESVAAIADRLLVPETVTAAVAAMRTARTPPDRAAP